MNQTVIKWPMSDSARVNYDTYKGSGFANYRATSSPSPDALINRIRYQVVRNIDVLFEEPIAEEVNYPIPGNEHQDD